MHAPFVTLWLQVVQLQANINETKWTPHVKLESDVAQSYNSSDYSPVYTIQFSRTTGLGTVPSPVWCNVNASDRARPTQMSCGPGPPRGVIIIAGMAVFYVAGYLIEERRR